MIRSHSSMKSEFPQPDCNQPRNTCTESHPRGAYLRPMAHSKPLDVFTKNLDLPYDDGHVHGQHVEAP